MEIKGLEQHADLLQYVKDLELRLAEYEQGACSFEKVAIHFRWCVEYILREYQKEYPACAAENSFGVLKNLQDLSIVDRSGIDALHQARKIGNKGGAHLTDETTDAKTVRVVFSQLLDFLPAFLERFPVPSKKELPKHQVLKAERNAHTELRLHEGNQYTIQMLQPTIEVGFTPWLTDCETVTAEHFTESDGDLYYNVSGIVKATRALVNTLKTRRTENKGFYIPGVAQSALGFGAIAYCAVPDDGAYSHRKNRYWAYARPNKIRYFEDVAPYVSTVTLPPCFAEDAFDSLCPCDAGDYTYMIVIKGNWYDHIKKQIENWYDYTKEQYETDFSYASIQHYEEAFKYEGVKKIVLPEELQPAALAWLNFFPNLEEVVLPSTMYLDGGVIYSKLGNQILALLRGKVDQEKLTYFLRSNPHTYVHPGADWGSGYEIRSNTNGIGYYLVTEKAILDWKAEADRIEEVKLQKARMQAMRQREWEENRKQIMESRRAQAAELEAKQKAEQAKQAQQAAPQKTVGGNAQQPRSGFTQTGMGAPAKRLCKSSTDRMLTGVCGGIATYFGISSSLVRLVVCLLGLSGLFFWGYVLLAIFLPKDTDK